MSTIIALVGRKGSGKSTLARAIVALDKDVRVCSFAAPLKKLCVSVFDLDPEAVFGPSEYRGRKVWGSDEPAYWQGVRNRAYAMRDALGRLFPDRFVGDVLARLADVLDTLHAEAALDGGVTVRRVLELVGTDWGRALDPNVWVTGLVAELGNADVVVVDDARFPNEVRAAQAHGGLAFFLDAGDRLPPIPDGEHSSEPRLSDFQGIVDEVLDVSGADPGAAEVHAMRILRSVNR